MTILMCIWIVDDFGQLIFGFWW